MDPKDVFSQITTRAAGTLSPDTPTLEISLLTAQPGQGEPGNLPASLQGPAGSMVGHTGLSPREPLA